ncbi:DNA polymerase delta catalytic subunit [Trichuris trichiura]|uniref:DNA polymerase n=1 Tax=Trichuris trichiura TaxID=36087 RepID=A0A077YV06_TRITR|nr:DNA polymerase delta catalytic subunit [Trichuris trichiura]
MSQKRKILRSNPERDPSLKRPRDYNDIDDDYDEPTDFEVHLANFEEDNGIDEHDGEHNGEEGPEETEASICWARPQLPDLSNRKIVFQKMDVDYYHTIRNVDKRREQQEAVLRIYGVTKESHSVCCHVYDFSPYFLVLANNFEHAYCDMYRESLDKAVLQELRIHKDVKQAVVDISVIDGRSIYCFNFQKTSTFLKVTVALPKIVPAARRIVESGSWSCGGRPVPAMPTFESNIDFEIRFMVDVGMTGCCWLELRPGEFSFRDKSQHMSRCQIEVDVTWKNLVIHSPEGEWADIAPFRILSFDIECAGRKGIFPEANKDPVIQIANMVQLQGEKEPFIRNIFVLDTCAPIVGCQVVSCRTEGQLLSEWARFVREVDPDLLTGYNIQNFDLPYLIDRAHHLKASELHLSPITDFPFLGRVKNQKTVVRISNVQSKQMGRRENKLCNIAGRVQFDLLQVLFRDYRLRSYTLNAVSFHFLQEQKEDVHFSIITDLQNGNEHSRRRLAVYCLKDAYLPLRLLEKLMSVINYIEMSRVTGVCLSILLTRGQQIKVISQLLRKTREHNIFLPTVRSEAGEDFIGATVIEPAKGYYNKPITTLDFASLYPSIMMAHNLCYTTLISSESVRAALKPDQYVKTPSGHYFVKQELCRGLLPEILDDLLKARKKVKEQIKVETDPFRLKVLDGRQLALKISANSVYGFTGAQVGKLPCLEISQSTTAFGRMMIDRTKEEVEAHFKKSNGYPADSKVIYGDTDSVMVDFGVASLPEAMDLGKEAAKFVSGKFPDPIRLEFEKVYFPFLLISKKRYAGLYFTKPDVYDKMDCKGIETVRRDNCPLVANVLSTCLEKILIDRNPNEAVEYTKQVISDLLCNRVDISQLIISKELTKTDKEYSAKQAHVELAARMRKRDAGSAPQLGDRVPYVIVAASKGTAAYLKAEDPIYVLENNIPIDTQYYLENQLAKPLLRIFDPILGEKAESILLHGEHTRTKTLVHSKVGGLMAFTRKKETCLGCKVVLPGKGATCEHCKANESEIYQREICQLNYLENKFARLWVQCQRCQGSLHEEVICTSRDCPIFYMRTKAKMDLQDQWNLVKRFDEMDASSSTTALRSAT